MPRLTCWFVRSSFINLALGFVLGGFILAAKGGADPLVWMWLPAHGDALLVGWLVQFGMGMAYWLFPRISGSRGAVWPVKLAFWVLTLGLVMGAGLPTLWLFLPAQTWLHDIMPFGFVAQAMAFGLFLVNLWRRAYVYISPVIAP
jgi:hypothetical protein